MNYLWEKLTGAPQAVSSSPLPVGLPDAAGNESASREGAGRSSVTSQRDTATAGPTSTQIGYKSATNSGIITNSHNINTNTSNYNDSNHFETHYNAAAEDPLKEFAKAYHADGAAFNSRRLEHEPRCLEVTRVGLLMDIMRWSNNPADARIFWLNGMAGTGKSTIARSVAHTWDSQKRLGASFFFSRGGGNLANASRFFATLAYQLAIAHPQLATAVRNAVLAHPKIHQQGLREQWKHLIFGPLCQLKNVPAQLILVIDALDECDGEKDTKLILELLSQANSLSSVRLQVLITSRPETPIQLGFEAIPNSSHREFILHNISDLVVSHDISKLFRHEFDSIRRYHRLPGPWPEKSSLDLLVQKANGLFIYVTTVCRFIGDAHSHPPERLNSVLKDTKEHGSSMKDLDSMYTTVLHYAIVKYSTPEKGKLLVHRFILIVGSIVVLFDTLSAGALAQLLVTPLWEVTQTLQSLSSVLRFSERPDIPITLLHPSFRDFLLNDRRCTDEQFRVAECRAHESLAAKCLALMCEYLKQDICCLVDPGSLTSEVDRSKIQTHIPSGVKYACRYWLDHLQRSNVNLHDGEPLHNQVNTFLNEHFLHWLEALGLMEMISDGLLIVRTLDSMLTSDANQNLRAMAHDAVRFVRSFASMIAMAPLQLYCSALIHSPSNSQIRMQYWQDVPNWIHTPPAVAVDWNSLCQVLEGHSGYVNAVAFSPDGTLLASASGDSTVRLWDPITGTCHSTLEGHSDGIRGVAFSPDGTLLASASSDRTVRLWDPITGTCHSTLEGHSGRVMAVAFSPDGTLLASASSDRTVRLWDPITGTCHSTLEGHSYGVNAVAFSPHGTLLASASSDRTVRLWDPITGTCHSTLEGHSDGIRGVAFSPDGTLLASASFDGTVRLWDPITGTCHSTLEGHSDGIRGVAFSPDGTLLASASSDRTVRLWDPITGTCHSTLEGHSYGVNAVAFSPDGTLLASASFDGTVRLWDPITGTCHSTLEGHSGEVMAVAFSPDGTLLASASFDGTVRLWDPITGTCHSTLEGHSDWIRGVAFSHDGTLLASASFDGTVRLWDPITGTCHSTLEGHSDWIRGVAFSPDGTLLASASDDRTVRLWDPITGTCHSTLEGHSGRVMAVAFSPDGTLLASASSDRTVRLWDPITGTCHSTLEGHSRMVMAVAFSPDGTLLASASDDRTVRLWDPITGTCHSTLEGRSGWIRGVAFSPDGTLLASASSDGTVRLWDPITGTCHSTLEGHSGRVMAVAFSPDGTFVQAQMYDKSIWSWRVDVDEPVEEVNPNSACMLCVKSNWISTAAKNLILLPPDCQLQSFAVHHNTVAIGQKSGRVSFFILDMDMVPLARR